MYELYNQTSRIGLDVIHTEAQHIYSDEIAFDLPTWNACLFAATPLQLLHCWLIRET